MAENILKLLDDLTPVVRKAFLASINDIKSEAQLAVIIGAIKAGNIDNVIAALNLDATFFLPLDDAMRGAYIQGGVNALASLPVLPDPFPVGVWLRGLMAVTHAPKPSSEIKVPVLSPVRSSNLNSKQLELFSN